MYSAEDWLPTFMAAAGQPKITERLLKGDRIGGKVYKVHLDPTFRTVDLWIVELNNDVNQ